ncbi:hypothetical protein [Thermococcus prieurii]
MRRLLVGLLVLALLSPATVWGWVREHGNVEKVVMLKSDEGLVVVFSSHSSLKEVSLEAERLAGRVCPNVTWEDGGLFSRGGLNGTWGVFKCPSLPSGYEKAQEWALKYYSGKWLSEGGWYQPFNDTAYENMVYQLFFGKNYTNSSS